MTLIPPLVTTRTEPTLSASSPLDVAPVSVNPGPVGARAQAKPPLKIFLAAPRGFCAGVDRAIKIVELALQKYGAPVYVRHEIVHNRYVVDGLRAKGAIFVEELDEVPPGDRPVIFSAHGVPKSVPADAAARNMFFLDATCPLVSKVHVEAERHFADGREIVMIGHHGHPEVIGTMGQLPPGAVSLIETVAEAQAFMPVDAAKLAFVTQTTLSVDDTADIVAALQARFPAIAAPHKEDICYATTNRQDSVKAIAPLVERLIVVGAPNSSNSLRLVEVAMRAGCPKAILVQRGTDVPLADFVGIATLGITAGASAPEILVEEVLAAFRSVFDVTIEEVVTREERVAFNVPRVLRDAGAR
jgi:4-hydroxy-3-methylbut-2-en-1-yl diphosphate reductase